MNIPPRILRGDFSGWLRDAMKARRMSARMVGLRTGINHSTVTRLLQGERQPTLATAVALLHLLGDKPADQPLTNGHASPQPVTNGRDSHAWPPDLSLL